MTLQIILEDQTGAVIERISDRNNASYLCQSDEVVYPLLSRLSMSAYDTFAASDMPALRRELKLLADRATDSSEAAHVREILRLAQLCSDARNWSLTFTPFDE